ncbi:MAG: glycogen/starch synthase [Brevinematia bacterium]
MFGKRSAPKEPKILNIAFISDHINYFTTNWYELFNFETYFLCKLSNTLQELGHNITVILPFHKSLENSKKFKELKFLRSEEVIIPERDSREEKKAEVMLYNCGAINLAFIKETSLSDREGFISDPSNSMLYPDNLSRFSVFARCSLESLKAIPFRPDVVHIVGKWASISAIYIKTLYRYDNFFRKSKVIFTISSIDDIPVFVVDQYPSLGLDWNYYRYEYLEFYGKVNVVKGAIVFSDTTTFCSNSYIEEIKKEESGKGLEGVIIQKANEGKIKSVLPGVSSELSPKEDKELLKIGANYSKEDTKNKKKVKSLICKKHKLNEGNILFLFIGDFKENTGISFIYEIFSDLLPKREVSLIIIGKGEGFRETAIGELVDKNKDKAVWLKEIKIDEITSYIAGADVILIPSISEPSSILPAVSMLYGTLPLVRGVGILNDLVRDKINGFKFYEYLPSEFRNKLTEVIEMYYKNPKRWTKLVDTAMKSEFSWYNSAKTYVEEIYSDTRK